MNDGQLANQLDNIIDKEEAVPDIDSAKTVTPGFDLIAIMNRRQKFLNDTRLIAHLQIIRAKLHSPPSGEADTHDNGEQYELITRCNKHINSLQEELQKSHDDLITSYHPKFPELEELLPDPILYKNAIKVIQNETDMTVVNDDLNNIAKLSSNQILTLSVAASTTSASQSTLNSHQLNNVNQCISYMEELLQIRSDLLQYLQIQCERLVPNTCVLIGSQLAARMIGTAGGLTELSRLPSCNLQVLGQIKHTSASRGGMGTSIASAAASAGAASSSSATTGSTINTSLSSTVAIQKPHEGMLAECELYNRVPPSHQRKALKVIAAKLALCIRCDYANVGRERSKESGLKFRKEIEDKFGKWEEPDKAPVVKALPKPDLTTKKRRGGKRMRRIKERFEETELMKQANRRGFSMSSGEYGDDAMGLTLGMLEKSNDGSGLGNNAQKLSRIGGEKRKMRQANTKASRKRAAQMAASSGQTNGLASSMVFTPVQGLELVNPDAVKDRVKEANQKWFGENKGFQSALPKEKK